MESTEQEVKVGVEELRHVVTQKLNELADRMVDIPLAGTSDWDTAEGQDRLRRWCLLKVEIAIKAKVDATGSVLNARRFGATWTNIGEACGTTKQAAYDRWGKLST